MFAAIGYNQQDIVKDGLVLWLDANDKTSYPGTGTIWRDLSRTYTTASLINGPTFNAQNGGSLVFDGADDYASTIAMSNILNPNQGVTLSYVLKTSNNLLRNIIIMAYDAAPPYAGITAEVGTYYDSAWRSGIRFYVASNSSTARADIYVNYVISNNVIYFVDLTYDYATKAQKIFLNGVQQSTSSTSVNPNNVTTAWVSSNTTLINNDSGLVFNGNTYNVRFYNRALSATEITQNFNALRGRYGI